MTLIGYSREDEEERREGLKLFVGSAKQMVQVPAGKRLLWALCLSNV